MTSRRTNATGRNATYPSRKRVIGLDQRAVVILCTATNITPADETVGKYIQLKRRERHARSGATNNPATKTTRPIAAHTMHNVFSDFGSGREVPARISSRLGIWHSGLNAVSSERRCRPPALAERYPQRPPSFPAA